MGVRNLVVGQVFGITIKINFTWAFIAALIAWSLAEGFFPAVYEGLPRQMYWWMAAAGVIGLAASILAHELSHSLVGRVFGIEVKTITLFLFGGAAHLEDEPPNATAEIVMAAAGPVMSLALAGAFNAAALISQTASQPLAAVLGYLAILNLILAVFNLIPAFPMDGGRVLRGAVWATTGDVRRATRVASRAGAGFGWVLTGLGLTLIIGGAFVGGLWWILIGQFIRFGALSSWRQMEARRVFSGTPAGDLMTPDPDVAPAEITLQQFLEDHVYRTHHETYPVVRDGEAVGLIGVAELRGVPREDWGQVTVADAMSPAPDAMIDARTEAMEALKLMQTSRRTRLMVTEHGRLVGVLTLKDLMEHLAMRLDVGRD